MTEGNGHVIDPNGDARRALLEAVAERGPEVLSDAAVMDSICRDQLTGLPGESILIGDAARTDIPALLNELIPRLGNYGAIQSAATTLAGKHNLDMAASLWVVREFARALGYIASGPATGTSASFPGSGPRPVPGSGPRPVPSSGPVTSSGTAEAEREGSRGTGTGGGEAGSARAAGAAGMAAGAAPGTGVARGASVAAAGAGAAASAGAVGPGAATGAGTGAAAGSGTAAGAGVAAGSGAAAGAGVAAGSGAAGAAGAGSRDGLAGSEAGASGVSAARPVGGEATGHTGGSGRAGTGGSGSGGAGTGRSVTGGGGATAGGNAAGQAPASGSFGSDSGPEGEGAGLAAGGTGAPGAPRAAGAPGSGPVAAGPDSADPRSAAQAAVSSGDSGAWGGAAAAGGPGAYGGAQAPGNQGAYGTAQGPGGPGAYAGAQGPGKQGAYGPAQAASGPGVPGSYGGAPGAGGSGGGSLWGGAPGGAAPEAEPGFPLPLPGGQGPGRRSQRSKVLNRNTVGIAAAIALVAGYLGVAAVAHLSPFPAKAAPPAQAQSQTSGPPASTSSSAASSPASSPAQTPTSQLSVLLTKIPATVKNSGECLDNGTAFGATAVSQCQKLQGLAANTIIYYLFPSRAALASGFSQALTKFKFHRSGACTTNGDFTDFIVNCQSDFTSKNLGVTGSVAEYPSKGSNAPIIVSTDNQQNVMAIMVGTNDGDLLAYWKQLAWVVRS